MPQNDNQPNAIEQLKKEYAGAGDEATPTAPDTTDRAGPLSEPLRKALQYGKWGALGGAGLGALRSAMVPGEDKSYLRDTLAGALIGGLLAGGTGYGMARGPFWRGGTAGKALEAGREAAMQAASDPEATPSEVAGRALVQAVQSAVSGEGEFGPEQQQALVSQLVKAQVPTSGGWRRRVNLLESAAQALQTSPDTAVESLQALQAVSPDPESQQLAGEAIRHIRSGRTDPNTLNALAAIGRTLQNKTRLHQRATHTIDALNLLKEQYAAGKLEPEEVAKNVGLLTGRFGSDDPQAERLRQLVLQSIARPIRVSPQSPYPSMRGAPSELSQLIRRATA